MKRLALLLCVLAAVAWAPAAAQAADSPPADTTVEGADASGDGPSGVTGAMGKLHLVFGTVGVASVAVWVLVWVALLIWAFRTPGLPVFLLGSFLVALVAVYALTVPRVGKVLAVLTWLPIASGLGCVFAWAWRRRMPLAFATFLLALVAFGLGMWNSSNIALIVEDRSAENAAARRRQIAAREAIARAAHQAEVAKLRSRAADVRFAEDAPGDAADAAGYREEELAKLTGDPPGEYDYRKGGKRQRDPDQIDHSDSVLDSIADDDEEASAARKLPSPDFLLAHRLDRINRFAVWLTLITALLIASVEYLRRFNRTFGSILPLPVACRAIDAIWPKTHSVLLRPAAADDNTVADYVDTVVRKRESFILLSRTDPWPRQTDLPRLPLLKYLWPLEKLTWRVGDPACDIHLAFESAWYGRYGFVLLADSLDKPLRAALHAILEILQMRHHTHAAARRTVHLIWDLPDAPPSEVIEQLLFLCRDTNIKFIAIATDPAPWPADAFEEICGA